jgi:para-aminobenzoate synthetase/4-amino-4-deoxychorismate lyase
MKMIAALEDSPRQVYTGAIGYMAPERKALFNVAIRTALIDTKTGTGIYGVGGGIVWDSDPDDEYQECLNKARVLGLPVSPTDFRLVETMSWTRDEGLFLLQEHLDRLADSAEYFDFAFDRAGIEARLAAMAASLAPAHKHRIRLLLHRSGEVHAEAKPIVPGDDRREYRLALAAAPVDARDPFLYHKTTQRDVYEKALSAAGDCDDVLLWNTDGNITESCIGNAVVRLEGRLWTPPVECGLLAGTFRRKLLREGAIQERTIGLEELADAEAIFLVNSVRGWMTCRLQAPNLVARQLQGRQLQGQ